MQTKREHHETSVLSLFAVFLLPQTFFLMHIHLTTLLFQILKKVIEHIKQHFLCQDVKECYNM